MKILKKGTAVVAEGYAYSIVEYIKDSNEYYMEEVGTGNMFYIPADKVTVAP